MKLITDDELAQSCSASWVQRCECIGCRAQIQLQATRATLRATTGTMYELLVLVKLDDYVRNWLEAVLNEARAVLPEEGD